MCTRLLFASMLLFCVGFDQGGCDCNGGGGGTTSGSTGSTPQCTVDTQCPDGQKCSANVCIIGCAPDHCASGACKDTNTCAECTTDAQCTGGKACCNSTCVSLTTATDCGSCGTHCGSGVCKLDRICAQCGDNSQCASAEACCGNACVSTHSANNCGGCGVTCIGNQFCSGTACYAPTFSDLCRNPNITLILDGLGDDDSAGNAIGDAIASGCGIAVARVAQSAATQIDPQTGLVKVGAGHTLAVSGGPFWQHLVTNLETNTHVMPIYFAQTADSALEFRQRSNDAVIAHTASTTASHDYFVLELATDPLSGALAFVSYGIDVPGTHAAAYYFATAIMPNASTQHLSEVVVEWTDTNGDSQAGPGDTYHVLSAQ